ncbi:phage protein [Vibrio phage pTD1]|uniref:Phage protein n=1 Tax=Vibrio phage pTD1 TaxID=1938577 RepID=A0A1Q2U2Y1_9CAUD|nr:nuclear shell protein [Vibrio phage pTD1]BAW98339.1 phage protein [Vibrio phage pTD1]
MSQANKQSQTLLDFASVLGMNSVMSGGRSVPVVNDVMKALNDFKEEKGKSSLAPALQAIIPQEIISMDSNLSPVLPGIILARRVGNTMIIAPIMFSNRELAIQLEEIHTNGVLGQNTPSKVQIKQAPNRYMTGEVVRNIMESIKLRYGADGVNDVQLITSRVINLEDYQTPENKEAGLPQLLTGVILDEWERGMKITLTKAMVKAQQELKTPFIDSKGQIDKNAYGATKSATARIEAVKTQNGGPVSIDGVPCGANMTVQLQTAPKEGQPYNTDAARGIVTAYSTVQLIGVPFAVYTANLMSRQQPQVFNPMLTAGADAYPHGYHPLQAVVVMNSARAQAQMGNNSGIASWLMGLYANMTVNHNHLFTEPLRMMSNGARGNLSHIERRIDDMIMGALPKRDDKTKINESRLKDMDFTSSWIRRNIAPHASYAIDLSEFGNEAALHNFLLNLAGKTGTASENKMTVVKVIDAITDGEATRRINDNRQSGKGWTMDKPILCASSIILPVGTFKHNGQLHSLEEVDEMFLSRLCPTDSTPMIQYLGAIYGDNGQTPEAVRRYKMTTMLPTLINDDVNMTGTARRYYIAPDFAEFLGQCMDKLGNLNASGTMGTFASNVAIYAPSVEFAVMAAAGASGAYMAANGGLVGNPSGVTFA